MRVCVCVYICEYEWMYIFPEEAAATHEVKGDCMTANWEVRQLIVCTYVSNATEMQTYFLWAWHCLYGYAVDPENEVCLSEVAAILRAQQHRRI